MATIAARYQRVRRNLMLLRTSGRADVAILDVDRAVLALAVDLLAQTPDVDVDDVREAVELVVPDVLAEHGPGDHGVGAAHEVFEDGVLLRGQVDAPAVPPDLPALRVERQVPDLVLLDLGKDVASEQGAQARQELGEGKGLDDVVVGAGVEPGHLVLDAVLGREHEDRRVDALGPEVAADGEPVLLGQHDVQDDEVVGIRLGQVLGFFSVVGAVDGVPLFEKPSLDDAGQAPGIFDNEDPHPYLSRESCDDRPSIPHFR
jgi:hypothetical protein